jgi:glycosyltransferase involved in cell wall biosynthesis
MRLLIANERLLFRFGLDRVLLVLATLMRARGHEVTLMANRLDASVALQVADRVIEVPAGGENYLDLNEYLAAELASRWSEWFPPGDRPDVALIGGWPFFASIPVFGGHGVRTAFLDCGAVPLDGMDLGHKVVQERLRTLRKQYLPMADAIFAISQFIENSQSRIDAPKVGVMRSLLLGADHLADSAWTSTLLQADLPGCTALSLAEASRLEGRDLLLNLGRWEPEGYKNSQSIFVIARRLLDRGRKIAFLVLDTPERVQVPDDLAGAVVPIGFPDDRELSDLIGIVRGGVSTSLWEGFNLPIAELQWQSKPAFAFAVGAHPEVVCDPWFLARDESEMIEKIDAFLAGSAPELWHESLERFRRQFAWSVRGLGYVESIEALEAARPRTILVDVTNACRDPANSGVMRVVRKGSRALQSQANVVFAIWSEVLNTYIWPTESEYQVLSAFNGPRIAEEMPRSGAFGPVPVDDFLEGRFARPTWLLLGETIMEQRGRALRAWARSRHILLAAIFYDAIPVIRPELVADRDIRENHAAYMKGLSESSVVMPISEYSARCLGQFWSERGIQHAPIRPCLLPDELGETKRRKEPRRRKTDEVVRILCVSTIEPRKGHMTLLQALDLVGRRWPQLEWTLDLVGNRYSGANSLALVVQAASIRDARIRWLGIVDDERLAQLYSTATFVIYPSEIEGFGMPILESLWCGTPCICHEDGVMAELAAGGGCFTTDVRNPEALAEAILALSTDSRLYDRLADQAVIREVRHWRDYSREIMETIVSIEETKTRGDSWLDRLYPNCLTEDWQMTDSERLALTGLLVRHRPRLAIEIGTYKGGSLSLISQFAQSVISIDIDPDIPKKFGQFKNVRFLTGYSQELLPTLLAELRSAGKAVDLILIDGDHSAAGVKRDIEIVLGSPPLAPQFILMHDGFNPECRRGMLEADWASSPHVRWVDTDFIPGRVIEHGGAGSGEMWGGLGAAFLTPETRSGPLEVRSSAKEMWKELRDRHYAPT